MWREPMTSTDQFFGGASAGAVRIDVELASSQEAVWGLITDSERLAAWLGGRVEIEPFVGGTVWFELPDDGVVASGVVRDVAPPTAGMAVALLAHTFVDARWPEAASECRWIVVDRGDGTSELHFIHDGFGEVPGAAWAPRLVGRTPIDEAVALLHGASTVLL